MNAQHQVPGAMPPARFLGWPMDMSGISVFIDLFRLTPSTIKIGLFCKQGCLRIEAG
jgi:hypothetical protein